MDMTFTFYVQFRLTCLVAHPLASGFRITAGSVKVILPKNITARNDYFIILFGDSGNKSPNFKVHHA
ncbi:hypothetical protein CPB84DRAFT_1847707 [Gymnopilus junonius]|uniref:Uncharacterized protein n=1 Tax=Gymnopilus junonius TaxID=109634 RepID=A0A9P5TMU4_GYMJU|nr:hypothetical protein CPB84DRAFT_1847707 [Gymnopilus junonius]